MSLRSAFLAASTLAFELKRRLISYMVYHTHRLHFVDLPFPFLPLLLPPFPFPLPFFPPP